MRRRIGAVGIIGLGHVGLATAACFASRGIETVGFDIDEDKVKLISRGKTPFVEEGLPRMLANATKTGKLRTTSDPSELAGTKFQFVTVQTPSSNDGSIDLGYVTRAAQSIGKVLNQSDDYKLVVLKSTVTPGTALKEVLPTLQASSGKKLGRFGLASNPEFLREGRAVEDTFHPDRIVIGAEDKRSQRALLFLYRRFYGKLPTVLLTTTVNAELIKYASNAFLATKLSFINEIANLSSTLEGADIAVVAKGMGLDKRIGSGFLRAGLGYGGSCLPKDVSALLRIAEREGKKLGVTGAAADVNARQPLVAVELAERLVGDLAGKRVALLGVAFKPDSDDMRDAVSLQLISELLRKNANVVAYDPAALENTKRILGDKIEYAESSRKCLQGADCCVLVTEWTEFNGLGPKQFKKWMKNPVVVDGRKILKPEVFLGSGVKFAAVGLGLKSN